MRRSFIWTWVLVLLAAAPLAAGAQQFTGTGQKATALFTLPEGLSVFEFDYRADEGDFLVRLLDDQGQVIDELARATGRFGGSKAIRIPRAGQYLLDVSAAGPWTIVRRGAAAEGPAIDTQSPSYQQGRNAGEGAASSVGTAGWFARGLLGGTILGPLGAGVTVGMAGRSPVAIPETPSSGAALDLAFQDGYREGFEQKLHSRRKKMAFVGGMVGSGILIFALIQALDIAGSGEASGGGPTPDPGTNVVRIPS